MGWEAGYNKWAAWRVETAGAAVLLAITGQSWEEAIDKLDVTHTGTAGMQALLAGILRGTGTVKANYDSAAAPHGAPTIKAGYRGQLQLHLGMPSAFLIPGMIQKVNYQSAVEGKVEYSFQVDLDYNAIATMGPYTYPT